MKSQTARVQLVAISGLVLFLAACSSVPEEASSNQFELTEPEEATSAQFELTETHVFSGFGFSVDYPAG